MKNVILQNILVMCGSLYFCTAKQLPSFIQKCSRADKEDLEKCLVQRTEDLKPYLLKGIPELKLPPIEPLRIPKFELHTGSGNAVSFDLTLTDIAVNGVKDYNIKRMDIDFDEKKMELHLEIPKLSLAGTYTVNGKVLLFELSATGILEANVTDIDVYTYMNLDLATRNGKEYIDIKEDYKLDYKFGALKVHLSDLFKGNQQLTEEANKAINGNSNIVDEIKPSLFDGVHLLVIGIVKPMFQDYSIGELFD